MAAARDRQPPGPSAGRSGLILRNGKRLHLGRQSQPTRRGLRDHPRPLFRGGQQRRRHEPQGARDPGDRRRGRTVFPGFIDAHTHPAWGGVEELTSVNCDLPSIAAIKAAIRQRALATPPGEWVVDSSTTTPRSWRSGGSVARISTKRRLTIPVVDQASGWSPSLVQQPGVRDSPESPSRHRIRRAARSFDETASSTAGSLKRRRKPSPASCRRERPARQRQAGVALMARLMTAAGLTSVHDVECSPAFLTAYQDAYQASELLFRVYVLVQGYAPIYQNLQGGRRLRRTRRRTSAVGRGEVPRRRFCAGAHHAHEHALRRST